MTMVKIIGSRALIFDKLTGATDLMKLAIPDEGIVIPPEGDYFLLEVIIPPSSNINRARNLDRINKAFITVYIEFNDPCLACSTIMLQTFNSSEESTALEKLFEISDIEFDYEPTGE